MSSTRDQIIDITCDLLEAQGYHATGLSQIIAASGAPRGSLYYYFPGGKEELAAEAIARAGTLVAQRIRAHLAGSEPAPEALRRFILVIADAIESSGFRAGGPLTTIAMETVVTNERLNLACRAAYLQLQEAFAAKLLACGYSETLARQYAIFINAAIEGGIILSRTAHSGDPLREVAENLAQFLQHAPPT